MLDILRKSTFSRNDHLEYTLDISVVSSRLRLRKRSQQLANASNGVVLSQGWFSVRGGSKSEVVLSQGWFSVRAAISTKSKIF